MNYRSVRAHKSIFTVVSSRDHNVNCTVIEQFHLLVITHNLVSVSIVLWKFLFSVLENFRYTMTPMTRLFLYSFFVHDRSEKTRGLAVSWQSSVCRSTVVRSTGSSNSWNWEAGPYSFDGDAFFLFEFQIIAQPFFHNSCWKNRKYAIEMSWFSIRNSTGFFKGNHPV